ncbi:MAG: resE11 [Clostridiales bacterium]|nr:resE11 [Clostridiales bacterium]
MRKWVLGELIDLDVLQKLADNLYGVSGIPVSILDAECNTLVTTGWQDICTKFHRVNSLSLTRCKMSDEYIKQHPNNNEIIVYKCMNNLWETSVPIIVEEELIGFVILGQFFYEDESFDIDIFLKQAQHFDFETNEYIDALKRVPICSREKVKNIIEYYRGLVITLVESSISKLQYINLNRKYSRLFNSMQDFIFVLDGSEKRFIECNKPFSENLYKPMSEFIGKRYCEVLPNEVSLLLDDAIQRLEIENVIQPFDYSITINNKVMWYSAQVSKLIRDVKEESEDYMIVCRDVTDRKHMTDELEKANNMKSSFIANISHELRTPITVILSAAQLLEMKLASTAEMEKLYNYKYINIVKQNCRRLLRLVNNIIDVTKVDAGFMGLHLQNVNIVNLIEKITMSVAEYAKAKNINVIFDTSIEEKTMAVDPDKIERIILNLLSNAIKFTERNKDIHVSVYELNMELIISIKDSGKGIPSEKFSQIFERFNQINEILSRSHEGSGIGLSLVKAFIEMHGGAIEVESELEKGSVFTIKLPIKVIESIQQKPHSSYVDESDLYVERLHVEFSDIYL